MGSRVALRSKCRTQQCDLVPLHKPCCVTQLKKLVQDLRAGYFAIANELPEPRFQLPASLLDQIRPLVYAAQPVFGWGLQLCHFLVAQLLLQLHQHINISSVLSKSVYAALDVLHHSVYGTCYLIALPCKANTTGSCCLLVLHRHAQGYTHG